MNLAEPEDKVVIKQGTTAQFLANFRPTADLENY